MLKEDHPDQEVSDDDVAIVIYKGMMGVEWSTSRPNKQYYEAYAGHIF